MVQLQLLTAARSGEIVKMRPCDIDCSGPIWFYRPTEHKTAHHGHERKIFIGPKAWYKQFHWHPHQLRHNAATFLRKEFGLETARIILGHRSAAITEVYAELDQQKALAAIVQVG